MDLHDARHAILFGGTFDPPTRAHVELPELVREKVEADLVAYIPAAQSPHKLDRRPTPPEHRVAMLRVALEANPHATILLDEIERAASGEPSYTVETLEALRHRLPRTTRLRLLIGADQLRAFHQWRAHERIVELAEPLVMVRPPDTRASLLADPAAVDRAATWGSRLIEVPVMNVSATEIRRRVAAGEPLDDLVTPRVREYIARHGLYRPRFPRPPRSPGSSVV